MFLSDMTICPFCNSGRIQVCEWSSRSAAKSPASSRGVLLPNFTEVSANLPSSLWRLGSCVAWTSGNGYSAANSSKIRAASPLPEPSPPSTVMRYIQSPPTSLNWSLEITKKIIPTRIKKGPKIIKPRLNNAIPAKYWVLR